MRKINSFMHILLEERNVPKKWFFEWLMERKLIRDSKQKMQNLKTYWKNVMMRSIP